MNSQELSAVHTPHKILAQRSMKEFCCCFKWKHIFHFYLLFTYLLIFLNMEQQLQWGTICVHLDLLNCSVNTSTLLPSQHLKWVILLFISNFFFSSREKGSMENPQSLDLKSLQVPKALQVEIENCLKLQLRRLQSLQNPPDPPCRVYNLHGFLPR